MSEITRLDVQAKNKKRANVYLDNKFFCGLELETVLRYSLKVGIEISPEKLEEIQADSEKAVAYNKTLNLISKRIKTEKEVKDYLKQKGYVNKIITEVVQKLKEYNFINDQRYVKSYITSHINSSGKLKLKQELYNKGISKKLIEDAIENLQNQTEVIVRLKEKYMKNKEDNYKNKQKLTRYLLSKGFTYDDIARATEIEGEY